MLGSMLAWFFFEKHLGLALLLSFSSLYLSIVATLARYTVDGEILKQYAISSTVNLAIHSKFQ